MPGIVLVTGSSGLLGSECVRHFAAQGWVVHGLDGNQRRDFFGPDGDTTANLGRLCEVHGFTPWGHADVRDGLTVAGIVKRVKPALVLHCAAQPSHDFATGKPLLDFDTNATGTLNMLEAVRNHAPDAVFCFASTNKVYGDGCNRLPLVERETRYEFSDGTPEGKYGLGEWLATDQVRHSVFGASKLAADVMVQEYAHTYGLKTGCFRFGCITGGAHAGAELHGFLAYLARCCREGRPYKVFGHKGKQVRDQLHARDAARAFEAFAADPRPGAVYNLGGGLANSVSVLEAIDAVQAATGKKLAWEYVEQARGGDHICWVSDTAKFRRHYPAWKVTVSLREIIEELCRQPSLSHRPTAPAT